MTAEEGKEETTEKDDKPVDPPAPPAGAPHVSMEQLERYRAEIRREFEEQKTMDAQERAEFRAALDQVNEWIKEQKKAQEERDKAHDTQGTIVVPPQQVAEGLNPPPENKTASESDTHNAGKQRGRGWKDWF